MEQYRIRSRMWYLHWRPCRVHTLRCKVSSRTTIASICGLGILLDRSSAIERWMTSRRSHHFRFSVRMGPTIKKRRRRLTLGKGIFVRPSFRSQPKAASGRSHRSASSSYNGSLVLTPRHLYQIRALPHARICSDTCLSLFHACPCPSPPIRCRLGDL